MFVFGSGVSHKARLYSDARAVYRACIVLGLGSSSGLVMSVLLLGRLREDGAGVGLRLLCDEVGVVSRVWLVLRGFCLRLLVLGVFGLREGRLLEGGGGGMDGVAGGGWGSPQGRPPGGGWRRCSLQQRPGGRRRAHRSSQTPRR